MVRAKTLEVMVQEYCQAFPDLQSEPDELYRTLRKHHFGVDQAKLMLISHSDLRLSDIFTLTLDDFVNAYPVTIEAESVRAILTLWSLTFGDLAEQTSEHFFMNNPIWERPLIDLGEDRFFWPIPSIFLSFCTELMVQVIEPFPDLIARHETWRGKYLENEVERLFGSAMPAAKIYRGNQWQDVTTGKLFENDLAVLVDTHLIIVEAKSGRMPASARRGAESSLENGIDELVVKASRQANRFAEYLQKNPGIHRFSTRAGRINEIDTSEVREVIRLNITLEPIGMLQTRLPEFQAAGYIPLDVDPVPSLLLTDLQTVFYILETTCEKLHYLRRRAQLEKKADYFADELDLLALYLDTGFNLGDTEANATLMLSTLSKTLDPHLMREWTQEDTPKPQHNLTQWWKDIIEYIEERKPPRWTEIGYMLLNVAYKDQVGFERRFAQVQKTVRKHWQMPGHKNNTILLYGPEWRREALVGVAYKEIDSRERNRLMSNTGGYAMEEAPASQALIIGIDVDRPHYPYNVVACTHKNEGDLVA